MLCGLAAVLEGLVPLLISSTGHKQRPHQLPSACVWHATLLHTYHDKTCQENHPALFSANPVLENVGLCGRVCGVVRFGVRASLHLRTITHYSI